jgi:hypothetical protein
MVGRRRIYQEGGRVMDIVLAVLVYVFLIVALITIMIKEYFGVEE